MIAARLDALSRDEKALVQDAAVIGKVFWPGAVAAMGDRSPFALEDPLHALERKEFIRRERRSAVAGETQYAFLHALVRDVAYGQIPRGQRVDKHRLAAEWIDSLSSERSEDRAEMLAHHYRQALELARAAGVDDAPLREPARQALIEATERASRLYAIAAIVDFGEAALELAGEDDPARPLLEFRLAEAYQLLGQHRFDLALSARDGFLADGDVESAAVVDILLARMYWLHGNTPASVEHREHALRLVEERPLSFAKARVFAQQARNFAVTGSADRALEFGERALPMAEELRDDLLMSHVLNTLGLARVAPRRFRRARALAPLGRACGGVEVAGRDPHRAQQPREQPVASRRPRRRDRVARARPRAERAIRLDRGSRVARRRGHARRRAARQLGCGARAVRTRS